MVDEQEWTVMSTYQSAHGWVALILARNGIPAMALSVPGSWVCNPRVRIKTSGHWVSLVY